MAARKDIPALTGIRGAAALWVAAYHLLLPAHFATGLAAIALSRGYLAVDLFFVLSGYVMALNYGAWFRTKASGEDFARFIARRAARLYPLYGAITASRFAYTYLRYGTFALPRPWFAAPLTHPARDIPANLLLIQSWGFAPSSIGPAWSVSVEWGAYFVFPALAALMLWRGRGPALALAAAAIGALAATAAADANGYHSGLLDAWDGQTAGPMLRCLAGFSLGIGVFRLSEWRRAAALASHQAWGWLLGGAFALGVAAGVSDLVLYPLFPLLVLHLACARPGRILASRPLLWLGDISYALYLLHIFALHPLDVLRAAIPAPEADLLAPALVFAILLGLSQLSFRYLERPGRRVMTRAAERLIGRADPRHRQPAMEGLTLNR